jgi:DNA adenine methylase
MIKTPLRYPGGKSRAIKQIGPRIPSFDEYREPFIGGGSVFIHCRQNFPDKKFWINDIYVKLFKFWQMAQKDMEGLINQIWIWRRKFKNGRVLHRFLLDNISEFSDLEIGAAFFILNRITFSGTSESGGFSEQAFQKRFTESSIDRVVKIGSLLENVIITNDDFQNVIEADGENIFIFLDPPYYSATQSALYGKNGNLHKIFDHERFAEVMKNCPHKWLITYDDSPYIRDLFSFAHVEDWELTYGMRNVGVETRQKATEIFISNY